MKVGRKIFFAKEIYNASGILQNHSRELRDSFNGIMVIIFRLLELNTFGVIRENNKIMAQFLHNIPGLEYGFMSFSGGNQVDGLPPVFIFGRRRDFWIFIWPFT